VKKRQKLKLKLVEDGRGKQEQVIDAASHANVIDCWLWRKVQSISREHLLENDLPKL
jgi:hypothetical protein